MNLLLVNIIPWQFWGGLIVIKYMTYISGELILRHVKNSTWRKSNLGQIQTRSTYTISIPLKKHTLIHKHTKTYIITTRFTLSYVYYSPLVFTLGNTVRDSCIFCFTFRACFNSRTRAVNPSLCSASLSSTGVVPKVFLIPCQMDPK